MLDKSTMYILKIILLFFTIISCKQMYGFELKDYRPKESFKQAVANGPVPVARLKVVIFDYVDFEGQKNKGEIVVLDSIAHYAGNIFDNLYRKQFPLHSAIVIDHFDGNDIASMEANNTSAYNPRPIADSKEWSLHAYGCAIDINPQQNPTTTMIDDQRGLITFIPKKSVGKYINRLRAQQDKLPGLAEHTRSIFFKNGLRIWGGLWNDPIDTQHFQIPRELALKLLKLNTKESIKLFDWYVKTGKIDRPINIIIRFIQRLF